MKKNEYIDSDDLTSKMIKCGQLLMHKTGKKRGQERILEIVYKHDCISQKELQNILQVEAGSLSEILIKLEKNGFIERYKDEKDKRKQVISLTQKGKDKIEHRKSNDEDMFDMLSLQESQQLNEMLDKIMEEWHRRHLKYHQKK